MSPEQEAIELLVSIFQLSESEAVELLRDWMGNFLLSAESVCQLIKSAILLFHEGQAEGTPEREILSVPYDLDRIRASLGLDTVAANEVLSQILDRSREMPILRSDRENLSTSSTSNEIRMSIRVDVRDVNAAMSHLRDRLTEMSSCPSVVEAIRWEGREAALELRDPPIVNQMVVGTLGEMFGASDRPPPSIMPDRKYFTKDCKQCRNFCGERTQHTDSSGQPYYRMVVCGYHPFGWEDEDNSKCPDWEAIPAPDEEDVPSPRPLIDVLPDGDGEDIAIFIQRIQGAAENALPTIALGSPGDPQVFRGFVDFVDRELIPQMRQMVREERIDELEGLLNDLNVRLEQFRPGTLEVEPPQQDDGEPVVGFMSMRGEEPPQACAIAQVVAVPIPFNGQYICTVQEALLPQYEVMVGDCISCVARPDLLGAGAIFRPGTRVQVARQGEGFAAIAFVVGN